MRCHLGRPWHSTSRRPAADLARSAFTLIELLVVIAVVATVIALSVPMLVASRAAAREIKSLANVRSHVLSLVAYTGDYRDTWPVFATPGAKSPRPRADGKPVLAQYFAARFQWHEVLAYRGYYTSRYEEAFLSPDAPREDIEIPSAFPDGRSGFLPGRTPGYTHYHYSCSFLADPAFWVATERRGPSQWRATRTDEVTFPSVKGLVTGIYPRLYAFSPWHREPLRRSDIGFVDGSAVRKAESALLLGEVNGDGPIWIEYGAMDSGNGPPGMHTVWGVRGRDRP